MRKPRGPLRGSTTIAAGLLTRAQLRTHYARLLPDVYLHSSVTPTPLDWAHAAWLWSGEAGVLCGWSAAAMWGHRWVPDAAPAEVIFLHRLRGQARLVVRTTQLAPEEIGEVDGVAVTTPLRTAYDLARQLTENDAVAAVDGLCQLSAMAPITLLQIAQRHPGDRGLVQLRTVVELADGDAESPWETRTRLVVVRAALPKPVAQFEVRDAAGRFVARLDLAWPQWKVALEYDGAHHRDGPQFGKDLRRHNDLLAQGWIVLRVTAADVAGHPVALAAKVRLLLRRAGAAV